MKQLFGKIKDWFQRIRLDYTGYFRYFVITCIFAGCGFLSVLVVVRVQGCKSIRPGATGANCIQATVLSGQRESQDSHKIGNVEHLEEREAKLVTSRDVESERIHRDVESERIHQKVNLISFVQVVVVRTHFGQFLQEIRTDFGQFLQVLQEIRTDFGQFLQEIRTDFGQFLQVLQEIRTDFGQFLQEIRKKRIERTGISKEIDLWNDFMEYLYWASNLTPSPRYGSWFSLGKRLYFPFFEKDKFFDLYYPKTYRYRIKNYKDRSNLDPRKIWPSKDLFSQGVLSLKAKFQPPIQIRLYPKEWSKTQGVSFESL